MTILDLAAELTALIAKREGFTVTSPALVASYLRDAMEFLEAQAEGRELDIITAPDLVAIGRRQAEDRTNNPWHEHGEVEGPRLAPRNPLIAEVEAGTVTIGAGAALALVAACEPFIRRVGEGGRLTLTQLYGHLEREHATILSLAVAEFTRNVDPR